MRLKKATYRGCGAEQLPLIFQLLNKFHHALGLLHPAFRAQLLNLHTASENEYSPLLTVHRILLFGSTSYSMTGQYELNTAPEAQAPQFFLLRLESSLHSFQMAPEPV